MRIKNYIERKGKSLVSVAPLGDAHAITIKRFDPDTGEETGSTVMALSLAKLQGERAVLVKELTDLNALIADLKASRREEGTYGQGD